MLPSRRGALSEDRLLGCVTLEYQLLGASNIGLLPNARRAHEVSWQRAAYRGSGTRTATTYRRQLQASGDAGSALPLPMAHQGCTGSRSNSARELCQNELTSRIAWSQHLA